MKVVISSYKHDKSISLFDITSNSVKELDTLDYYEPSFVIEENGYIITYSKEPITLRLLKVKNDKFELIDSYELPLPFTTLTHLCFNKENGKLYACSYKDGSYLSIDIVGNKFCNLKCNKKEKPVNGRDPLCHNIEINYDTKEIYIVDIKNDCVDRFNYDLEYLGKFDVPHDVGPRHCVYYKGYLYLVTEYSNEVYKIDTLTSKVVASHTTLISDCVSYGATLFVYKDELYASNRGEETIAKFNLDNLDYLGNMSVFGKNSRHMINYKDDIITLNKDTGNVVFIDIKTGKKKIEFNYEQAACACVIE